MKPKNNIKNGVNGFSLLEMTIVLIVMSILASAVIPVFTRSFLDKASEKVSLDVSTIQDAARAYYIANNAWPASIKPIGVTPATDLESNGFLPSSWNAVNPFGNAYTSSVSGSVFTVSTQVSNGSQIAIVNRLPASVASGNTVSSSVPPPGQSGNSIFGAWVSESPNAVYQALTDGYVTAYSYSPNQSGCFGLQGMTDSSSSPSTIVSKGVTCANGQQGYIPVTFPVRKGDYWEVAASGIPGNYNYSASVTVRWISIQ